MAPSAAFGRSLLERARELDSDRTGSGSKRRSRGLFALRSPAVAHRRVPGVRPIAPEKTF